MSVSQNQKQLAKLFLASSLEAIVSLTSTGNSPVLCPSGAGFSLKTSLLLSL